MVGCVGVLLLRSMLVQLVGLGVIGEGRSQDAIYRHHWCVAVRSVLCGRSVMWVRDGEHLCGKVDLGPDVGVCLVVRVPTWVVVTLSSGGWISGVTLLSACEVISVQCVPYSNSEGNSGGCSKC